MASEELEAHEAALPRAQRRGVRVAVPWASTRTRRGINIAARVLQRQVGVYRRPRRMANDYAADVLHARGFAHTRCCDVWCVAAVSKPDVTRVFRGFRVVKGHTGCVNAAAFSHDGNLIASGGDDTRVLVWRLKSMDKPLRVFSNHHDSNIFDLAFDWEDSHILSCGNDARVNLIDIHRGTCVLVRVWPHTQCWALILSSLRHGYQGRVPVSTPRGRPWRGVLAQELETVCICLLYAPVRVAAVLVGR